MNDEVATAPRRRSVRLSGRDLEDAERLLSLLTGRRPENPHAQEATCEQPRAAPDDNRAMLLRRAKEIFTARRRRTQIFGKGMFGEPAWDMLLVLYMSEQHGSRPTISSLTQFSGARPTTALRWLDYLEAQQLIGRETHPTDRRAALVWITDKAREALDSYLCETLGTEA